MSIAHETDADLEAITQAVAQGCKVDPEVAKRVRERADQVREETRRQHGIQNIGVDIIREMRDAR